eukprot:CAMPEP_0115011500 /NCGR_PEP_ID=MMETSP0216-20121206/24042_1 /TAXON_ID=223996 /ORGANISM="Protocruzia adherens, Strain Boccale" /LENGTH=466 /DNA_ID=CAMNT_0002380105 /DNA_START=611 /DNA_END=2011 /DNA_ORIENTATION=+
MTVKDNIRVKGMPCTAGFLHRLVAKTNSDGPIASMLKKAGGILMATTSMCTLGGDCETYNAIAGRAVNPWNHDRTTGGSTGGEAGCIAAGMSPLGLGTDIGGSIRGPSNFCGIYGLKPSNIRVSQADSFLLGMDQQDGVGFRVRINAAVGPMARCVEDLATVMRLNFQRDYYTQDHCVGRKDFSETEYNSTKPLKIGYYKADFWYEASPSVGRAVQRAVEALKTKGHEVVPFELPKIPMQILISAFTKGFVCSQKNTDKFLKNVKQKVFEYHVLKEQTRPIWQTRMMYKFLLWFTSRSKRELVLKPAVCNFTGAELTYFNGVWGYQSQRFFDSMDAQGIDAIVCPVYPVVAGLHKMISNDLGSYSLFNVLANVLHAPAGVVPVTEVTKDEEYMARNPKDHAEETGNKLMKNSRGMPIGVQVYSKPYEDETVLRVMKDIESEVQFKPLCTRTPDEVKTTRLDRGIFI